jgi:protein-disulfide isomerase
VNKSKSIILAILFSQIVGVGVVAAGGDDTTVDQQQPSTVVATVGDHKITVGDLEKDGGDSIAKAKSQLLQARLGVYNAEHNVLEKEIDLQLVSQEAAKEHVSVDELLKRHVSAKVKEPGEETVKIYYLATGSKEPYDVMRPKIIASIRSLEENKARQDYIDSLRNKGNIQVALTPPKQQVATGALPTMGPQDAAVTVVEFADYQCPYCRQVEPSMEKLRETYKDRIKYSYRDFPLPMHQYAEKAAEASRCAGEQGKFWPYHDQVFKSDTNLDEAKLKSIAHDVNLDTAKFDKCLESSQEADAVKTDLQAGKSLGITGTPTVFVNGHVITGAVSYDTFKELVDQQIAESGKSSASASNAAAKEASPGS